MRQTAFLSLGTALWLGCLSTLPTTADAEALLDSDLSQWQTYLGYPRAETPVDNLPRNTDGSYSQPLGYERDPLDVFSTMESDGETLLRISGEIYGGIYTRRDFANYRLTLQVKWGEKKWPPRLELPRDTGILYHGTGEHGVDYWKAWPLSQEFQIVEHGIEGSTGDWWKIADSRIDIRCSQPEADTPYRFDPETTLKTFGGTSGVAITCRASHNNEKPLGQWNSLELIVVGDKSLHIVNGDMVMALTHSSSVENGEVKPLTSGRIVLQSEAAEVFYRRINITSLDNMPEQYQSYFE